MHGRLDHIYLCPPLKNKEVEYNGIDFSNLEHDDDNDLDSYDFYLGNFQLRNDRLRVYNEQNIHTQIYTKASNYNFSDR